MDWLNILVTAAIGLIGALGGGSIIYWKATRKLKEAEAQKSTTDARSAEVDLTEKIMEKFQRIVLDRMDQGDAVRSKEFKALAEKVDSRFDAMEHENKSQNGLLADIVEFLNGDFQAFEANKHKKGKKS